MSRAKSSIKTPKASPSSTSSPSSQAVTSSQLDSTIFLARNHEISDVLVVPRRVVPRLADLAPPELSDLMISVQHVGSVIERVYKAQGLTIACQDGIAAGQTVPHVHFHLLPRKLRGDPYEGHNDQIYPVLEHSERTLPEQLHVVESKKSDSVARSEPIRMDADEDRKPRLMEDMEKEASRLREYFDKDEEDKGT